MSPMNIVVYFATLVYPVELDLLVNNWMYFVAIDKLI